MTVKNVQYFVQNNNILDRWTKDQTWTKGYTIPNCSRIKRYMYIHRSCKNKCMLFLGNCKIMFRDAIKSKNLVSFKIELKINKWRRLERRAVSKLFTNFWIQILLKTESPYEQQKTNLFFRLYGFHKTYFTIS